MILLTISRRRPQGTPYLGNPALVMRDNTERSEAVDAGTAKLVGTDETEILQRDEHAYRAMARGGSPFGEMARQRADSRKSSWPTRA